MKLIRPSLSSSCAPSSWPGAARRAGARQGKETAQTQTGPTWESRTPSEAFQGIQGLRRPL